jgi:hypothetical protein
MPAAHWLAGWQRDPAGWLAAWCDDTRVRPARWLRAVAAMPCSAVPARPLRVHADAAAMRTWARELREGGAAFARQPTWDGACAETGVWTRLADTGPALGDAPALRLGVRLAEVARLAQHDTAWLAIGALPLGAGEGIAWAEMARGLLVHHVRLDGTGEGARIASCHVVAPTEWNFHPRGAMARVLEAMPAAAGAAPSRALDAWMAAYDPCVPYQQELPVPRERAHA